MPRKKLKCSKCDRSFSMAAHLARHMGTIHAAPGARKAKKTKKGNVPQRRKPGRPSGMVTRLGLRDMSLAQLQQVIVEARGQARLRLDELSATFGR